MRLRPALPAFLLATLLLAAPSGEARADDPTVEGVVRGSIQRARRAVALGPTVGVGGAYLVGPGEMDVPISFGLELALFKVEVLPTPSFVMELAKERAMARAKERAAQMIAEGRPAPTQAELEALALQVYEDVKAEVLGELSYRTKTIEKPRFRLAYESAYLADSGAWQHRTTAAIGVGKVSLGPTIVGQAGAADGLFLGGEVAAQIFTSKSPRAPIVDLYLRVDFGVTDEVDDTSILGVGARFLLDVI